MMLNYYVPFSKQVNQPYSLQEQEMLVRIIKTLTFHIRGGASLSCSLSVSGKCYLIAFCGSRSYFRLTLPEKDPFSTQTRLNVLGELEKRLHCFLLNQIGDMPYSFKEQQVLKKIRKLLIHQLRETPKYDLFKSKRTSRLTDDEQAELDKQRVDETRLKLVSLYHYNPLSQKFKKIKEDFLEEMKRKFGED